MLLKSDMPNRDGFNVSDFFAQLQKRSPLVPVQRDDHGTFIPESAKVCFLDHRTSPRPEERPAESPSPKSLADRIA